MYKKNYFFLFFFVVLSLISLMKIYDYSINHDMWEYGEWLINYQHGFVRRGLVGEIIFLTSKIFQNNIEIAYFIVLSLIVIIYYFLNYVLIRNIKLNFINLFIIFSPLFYLFFIVISKVGIRKEIILYTFYLLYLIHLSSSNFTLKKNWKFIIFFPVLLLNHEGTLFYLPYVIIPLFFVVKENQKKEFIYQVLLLFITSIIVQILVYYNKGTTEHTLAICESLGVYAPAKCVWWGPFFALGQYLGSDFGRINEKDWFFFIVDYKTFFGFVFYFLYSFLPILCFFLISDFNKKIFLLNKNKNIVIFIIAFLFSLPLFLLAHDWSRWASINFHLMAYLIFFFQRLDILNYSNNNNFIFINNDLFTKKIKIFYFIVLFLYATFFHHHHFFFKGVKLEFTYYKIYTKIKGHF